MTDERRAVVVGASMAGLLAARVFADRATSVTLVDRDDLPQGADARKGVPQGRHAHGLLPSGEAVIRQLCPGLMEELIADGAQRVSTNTGRWWQASGYRIHITHPEEATFCSRPFLEAAVRRRILELPNVDLVKGSARHLITADGRVKGVAVDTGDGEVKPISADLVVDATGRGSQASRWMESLGYAAPPVATVTIDITYGSRYYRRTPGRLPDGTWFVTIPEPDESRRIAVAFPVEGDRWIVTLAGVHGDRPPTEDAGFQAFAESLPTDGIADIIRSEEPLGPIVAHRLPSSQWRHFDRLKHHPAGFLAIGDSICSFNPIYGQGMSSAAQQAMALAACIDRTGIGSPKLWKLFYKKAKKVIANPWAIAAGGDFAFSQTTGDKPPATNAINRYVRKVVIAAQHDETVARAMFEVQGLLAPPPSLMKPAMMLRVLRAARRGPTGTSASTPSKTPAMT